MSGISVIRSSFMLPCSQERAHKKHMLHAPDTPELCEMMRCGSYAILLNSSGACGRRLKSKYNKSWATSNEDSPPWATNSCGVAGVCGCLGCASNTCCRRRI